MSLNSLKNGEVGGEQQQRKCPNPPLPPLDHKVMSKAERRRAAKNIQPPTREEREQARENIHELRIKMRNLKSHGWRGKVRRGEKQVEKRGRNDGFVSVGEDGADFEDAQEEKILREKMGSTSKRTTTTATKSSSAASAIPQEKAPVVSSTRNKKYRAEEDDGDVW